MKERKIKRNNTSESRYKLLIVVLVYNLEKYFSGCLD